MPANAARAKIVNFDWAEPMRGDGLRLKLFEEISMLDPCGV